jgi:lysine 2,3-aminomutase
VSENSTPPAPRRTARRGQDLLAVGVVSPARAEEVDRVSESFSLAVSPHLLDLIDPDDPVDPIARQFIPSREELVTAPEEMADPIGDDPFTPVKGITHRYPDRLLLKPLHVCPVYCRFCFRREKVGPGGGWLAPAELEAALEYIRGRPEVWEVILSGGDPLILSPRHLGGIIRALAAIAHVEVIRIHSRVPVVTPERVTADLVQALKGRTPVYVVLHCNHPRELTPAAVAACARLADAGVPLLSQSVLLRGVNDDPATLSQLLRALVRARVKPYYLHQGDLARGTAHFRTTLEEGQELMRALRGRLSGICQPTYVLDIPGGHGKVPVGPTYLSRDAAGGWLVEDYCGKRHPYPPPAASVTRNGAAAP